MSQYRAYPAYKDSGIEWIGQVPEHWKVARVKRLVSLRNERRNDVSTDTIYIGLEDVEAGSGQYKPTNGSSRQSDDSTVGIFYEGDVLYGKLRPYLRKAIISEMAGCCSTEFLVLRAEKTEPRWLQEWLLTPDVTHQIESGCEGAKMPRADWGHIGSIEVAYPDQPEQAQILTTLDRETARIDALIQKKTRFIELLKEKRQALITHAVTKGLDPNAKMKDSGIEWIGQVPEHWKIAQIKRISALNPRKSTLNEEKDSLCTFLPMEKLRTNAVTLDETRPIHEVYGGYSYFCDGDILIAKVTPCFENGNIAVANGLVNGIGFGSTEINVLRVNGKGHNRFLYYRLQEEQFRTIAKSEMRGTGGLKRVPTELFESFAIGLPDTDEQATIAATLDRETARIDALIGKAEQSITLLKERRAAFITAAVTGQIDLRGKQ
ncbi:restriction endonuclease subunit S [Citrobacter werkmanii]|uniref:restriction endonuclease subunit S n=1 Tax=Citrobacter werkmanii TaxID=67827 RepID=UPI0013682BBD|nr:restriction endonuclease subunit S [Citrobacter werkmanii]EDT8869693.1 restriction endonuclease subunit S [Salmonella enterica subsp. enterica serovar Mbandaka]MYL91960.1 restriction endonuclease subunit S [Citrobacter werkmanii]